jgi:hypothetical protein
MHGFQRMITENDFIQRVLHQYKFIVVYVCLAPNTFGISETQTNESCLANNSQASAWEVDTAGWQAKAP